jgi:phospholipid transport system substrate-binding protein
MIVVRASFLAWLFLLVLSFSTTAAINESPYEVVKKVGDELFKQISVLSEEQRKNPETMKAIIEHQLMPYVDYRFASYKILGKYVKTTSPEQREEFVKVMYQYLLNTYASALLKYKNQQIKYEPEKPLTDENIVTVHLEIVEPDAPVINLDFKLRKNRQTGEWKAFDMVVEGVSLLSSKQAEISSLIRTMGIEQTIEKIKQQNT